jgi:hypothetical protein
MKKTTSKECMENESWKLARASAVRESGRRLRTTAGSIWWADREEATRKRPRRLGKAINYSR